MLNVGGIVSATQFTGDGSELTGITAEQVGALVSVDGLSNPGGDIDLVQDGAITITSDNTNNQITIGETHSSRTNNPHQVTAQQVGAIASINDVSSAGGDIDLIPRNAITIEPDNQQNQIIIGETHSSIQEGNPHQVTAQQVGAITSINDVSPAGGDIDLIPRNAITIEPDNQQNQIIIGETHSSIQEGNPHQVTAQQVGAVAVEGGTIEGLLTLQGNLIVNGNVAIGTQPSEDKLLVNGTVRIEEDLW